MTTRSDDELAVPHFEDRLWRELEALHASQGAAGPVPTARAARRPWLLAAAAVVAIGGAVAGVATVTGPDGPTTVVAPGEPATTPGATTTPTTGTTATDASRPNQVVLTEHRNAAGETHRRWVDERTGRTRELSLDAAGRPTWDSGWLSVRMEGDEFVVVMRDVDHCFREWEDTELRVPTGTAEEALPDDWRVDPAPDAMLAEPGMVAEGTEVVDGRETVRYRDTANDAVLWLDPDTHDYVRRADAPGTEDEQTTTYEYLPRTPENLAVVEPEVPPGFTTPRQDHTDEERAAAGCT